MLQLKYKNNEKPPVWLVDKSYSLGAGEASSVHVSGSCVKPHHANIEVEDDKIILKNLVGDNLVKVNGIPVSDKRELKQGDELIIGTTFLLVFDPKQKAAEPIDNKPLPKAKKNDRWAIVASNAALQDRRYDIDSPKILGRSKECDISLNVSHLSRNHAKLSVTDEGLIVEDLGSSNGTFVNGQQVKSSYLKTGDELSFDTLTFRVEGPALVEDRTTIRPVVKIPGDMRQTSGKMHQQRKPSQHRTRPQPIRPEPSVFQENTEPNNSGTGLAVGVGLVLIVIAGIGWFWLTNP